MSKRLFAITLVFSLMIAAPFAVAQEETVKGPRLTLVEPLKDFGTVPKGEKLDWAFVLKNTGTTDLEILAAKPTCGCTVADFDKVIKPGQTGTVKASVDTISFVGPISKAVTLETNDPNAPNAQVTITAVVKPFVDIHPVGYVRYNMLQGDAEKQSLTLYSDEVEPFEVLKVESPQEWIKVEHSKIETPLPNLGRAGQTQYKFDFTVGGPNANIGPIAEKVLIRTNSMHQPDFWVSVTGVVRPTIRIEPTAVNFGEITVNDSAATRFVSFRSNNLKTPETFVVTKVESNVAGLSAKVSPSANKGEYMLELQIDKDAKPGMLDGTVTVFTSDKIHPTVTIPVRGTVKPAGA
ncbi:MAG TPA: DUF1573 domain-containing protein [Thermoanaerobaculia bacterium]|nr:DUF1573 domain-containing protein [Thermoanaerobaculia bacterium]